jgi:PIN domain nuclease of toxin-antitoxin system
MRPPVVMDSSAMSAIALAEQRARRVVEAIRAYPDACFIHSVNAYEVAAKLVGEGIDLPGAWKAATFGGVRIVTEITGKISLRAVELKIAAGDLSLGDCHCLAFAEGMGGCILTTDGRLAKASKIIETVYLT